MKFFLCYRQHAHRLRDRGFKFRTHLFLRPCGGVGRSPKRPAPPDNFFYFAGKPYAVRFVMHVFAIAWLVACTGGAIQALWRL